MQGARASESIAAPLRLDSLTGLRALAALLVFAYHIDVVRGPGRELLALARYGFIGVGLFYMLSGLVLTWSWKPTLPRRRFYWLRFARVYPIYALAVTATALIDWVQGESPQAGPLLATLGLVQSWIPDQSYYFGVRPVFWSLSVEAFFYAIFPFVIPRVAAAPVGARRSLAAGCLGILALIAAIGWNYEGDLVWLVYVLPLSRLPEFIIGIVIGLELRDATAPRVRLGPAVAGVVVAYSIMPVVPDSFRPASFMAVFFAALLVAVSQSDISSERSPFRAGILVTLGLWSYALYLLHTTLIGVFDKFIEEPVWWTDGLLVVIGCLAAGIVYIAVEKPVERRLREPGSLVRSRR